MKKGLFLIPAAALALASCSNDDFSNDANNGLTGETETRYLAVNLVDVADGTRANNESDYKDGVGNENKVNTVRFFLFGESGYTNTSIDCTVEPTTDKTTNVEKKFQAVIVYEQPKDNTKPVEIVAVVNPPSGLLASYPSAADLQGVLGEYEHTASSNFIMSNSVYVETSSDGSSTKTEHVGYKINQSYDSREAALAAPVEIYVERVVAKASVTADMTKVTDKNYYIIQASKESTAQTTVKAKVVNAYGALEDKEIYLELLGWNVTGTAQKSRLVKKVETSWDWDDWGTTNYWNKPDYFRSFWALNPADVRSKDKLNFGTFNTGGVNAANGNTDFNGGEVYMQENAAWNEDGSNPGYATKLIVAGRLVDVDGNAIDLSWWKGSYYLESALLATLATESRIYSGTPGDAGSVNYTPLNSTYIDFKTATELEGQSAEVRYFSYVQLKDDAVISGDWYTKGGDGTYTKIEAADVKNEINRILKGLGEAKVWRGGNTYYWTDIAHLGTGEYGANGIVRNHIYDYKLKSFVGFGIPVLKPGETIYPEEPNDPDYAYIAAKLNILSWRLVYHNDTQLGWD